MEPANYNHLKLEAVRRTSRFLELRKFIDLICMCSAPVMLSVQAMMPNFYLLLETIDALCFLLLSRAIIFAILDITDCHFQRLKQLRSAAPTSSVSAQ